MAESRLGLETYKVRLEHLVRPESKKMVKTKEKKKKKSTTMELKGAQESSEGVIMSKAGIIWVTK